MMMMIMFSSSSGLKGYLILKTVCFLIKISYLNRKTKYFALQWVAGALSLGVKRPGREDHSPPSSAGVKNAWSYTSTPPIHLHGVVLS
jgi:hypothetical protein